MGRVHGWPVPWSLQASEELRPLKPVPKTRSVGKAQERGVVGIWSACARVCGGVPLTGQTKDTAVISNMGDP